MNKSELVLRVAERAKLTKKRAEQIVNLIFDEMTAALKDDRRIEIRGFGSFTTKSRDAYTGRNPKTNEPFPVAAKKHLSFKVGKELKERVDYPENANMQLPPGVVLDDDEDEDDGGESD